MFTIAVAQLRQKAAVCSSWPSQPIIGIGARRVASEPRTAELLPRAMHHASNLAGGVPTEAWPPSCHQSLEWNLEDVTIECTWSGGFCQSHTF